MSVNLPPGTTSRAVSDSGQSATPDWLALTALNLPGLKTERLTHAEAKVATAKIGKALARERAR